MTTTTEAGFMPALARLFHPLSADARRDAGIARASALEEEAFTARARAMGFVRKPVDELGNPPAWFYAKADRLTEEAFALREKHGHVGDRARHEDYWVREQVARDELATTAELELLERDSSATVRRVAENALRFRREQVTEFSQV